MSKKAKTIGSLRFFEVTASGFERVRKCEFNEDEDVMGLHMIDQAEQEAMRTRENASVTFEGRTIEARW